MTTKTGTVSPVRGIVVLAVLGFIVWWFLLRGGGSHPWSISVDGDVKYTGTAVVGGDIDLSMVIRNAGTQANPATRLQLSDLDHNADLSRCEPECQVSTTGGLYATFPGVAPGTSASYTVHLIAKAVGAPHWTICLYDAEGGAQVYCGSATSEIR